MNNKETKNIPPSLSKLGHYRIVEKIGQGGMSCVYKAFDEKLKRSVAIKVLHTFLAEKEEARERFFREAQAGARLAHPNILQIYDVVGAHEKNDYFYIVSEFVKGKTLAEWLKENPLNDVPEIASMIIWQLALALEHAHQQGVIHRDIKPENIMVREDGLLKLMDFGLARINSHDNFTQSGVLLGSFSYMAPEIVKGQQALAQTDIFSLSVMFYFMLTGLLPFSSDNPSAILKKIVEEEPLRLQTLSEVITDDLAEVVYKGLRKDPKKRYTSAYEMALAIENVLKSLTIIPDEKLLSLVLKNPSLEIQKTKSFIEEKIKAKLIESEKQKDEITYLILSHRLGAQEERKQKKHFPKKLYFVGISLCCILFFSFSYFYSPTKTKTDLPYAHNTTENLPEVHMKEEEVYFSPFDVESFEEIKIQKQGTCDVMINVWPYATIYKDGKVIGKDVKKVTLKLNEGKYHFIFMHPFAATKEETIEIKKNQKQFNLSVDLVQTKPSFLIVNSNVDADVIIEDAYKGTCYASAQKPILLKLPDKTHSVMKDITLSKEGYFPVVIKQEFIAGRTITLEVVLKKIN